jgi:twitching motility protein PilT
MDINTLIKEARGLNASDLHLSYGRNPMIRVQGSLIEQDYGMSYEDIEKLILSMCNEKQRKFVLDGNDLDFSYSTPEGNRQRVNIFHERGRLCAALRLLNDKIKTFEELKLPPVIKDLANEPRGLILITGPTGSGKTTTLAAMIDYITKTRRQHIITIEDPIEYSFAHNECLVNQREIGLDVNTFDLALKSAMREDPDIILVGEMRDFETIQTAITAAETGHLVLSTLHTSSAYETIDRIIDIFPEHSKQQIRVQLANSLKGVVTQNLVPLINNSGRAVALEVMVANDAIKNLIRENKTYQIPSTIQTSTNQGMKTMNKSLAELYIRGYITKETAFERATDKNELKNLLGGF